MVSHQAVREALAAHPTAGVDQQVMVRDLCQGGRAGRGGGAGRDGQDLRPGYCSPCLALDGFRLLAAA